MTNATPSTHPLDQLEEEVKGRTTFVLDTSVLVADPACLTAMPDADLVIPMTVIDELDELKKKRDDQQGANARAVIRNLEEHRLLAGGSLSTPVDLPNGATLRVEPNGLRLDLLETYHLPAGVPDHRILAAALGLASDGRKTVVVSCDGAMRLKADTVGLEAVDYTVLDAPFSTRDKPGWHTVEVSQKTLDSIYEMDGRPAKPSAADAKALSDVVVNEFVVARSGTSSALARQTKTGLTKVRSASQTASWGVRSRNKEQQFALELLLDADVEVVALSGRAGTGKTLLAIAAALEQTFEKDARYDRVMILRPMYAIGKQDIGFLPGEVADKVAPWFDAVVDSMVALSTQNLDHKACRDLLTQWVEQGKLAMEPVTFLRGRSLARTLVIIDEMQNLESAEAKTILTRLGEGSKIVLCGDPDQCDNPFTTPAANGLTAVVAAFRGQDLFGHVALSACERSRVADLAADLL